MFVETVFKSSFGFTDVLFREVVALFNVPCKPAIAEQKERMI